MHLGTRTLAFLAQRLKMGVPATGTQARGWSFLQGLCWCEPPWWCAPQGLGKSHFFSMALRRGGKASLCPQRRLEEKKCQGATRVTTAPRDGAGS